MPRLAGTFQKRLSDAVYKAGERRHRRRPSIIIPDPEIMSLACGRAQWLGFHGRLLRPRGCEGRAREGGLVARRLMLRDLRGAGYRVNWAGPLDCGYIYGLGRRVQLLELQAVPEATFRRLKAFGLGAAIDLETALQCRLGLAGLKSALFVAENKNSQELYFERICFDPEIFREARERAAKIRRLPRAPAKNSGEGCLSCRFKPDCREA